MNVRLIQALLLNQGLILGIATVLSCIVLVVANGGSFDILSPENLQSILHWSSSSSSSSSLSGHQLPSVSIQFINGFIGCLPLLAVSNFVESSDKRKFAQINFSTINMALTLFGRRKQPPIEFLPEPIQSRLKQEQQQQPQQQIQLPTTNWPVALFESMRLSIVTGLCEEVVFRQEVPTVLSVLLSGNNGVGTSGLVITMVWLGQAVLFALGHAQGGVSTAENAIVLGLQFLNGLGFGLLYIVTGGDLVSCIVAHALYDFVTFFKTWMDANDQLEYAESMYQRPLSPDDERQIQTIWRMSNGPMDPALFNSIKRLFYIFDFDKNQTLSLSEVRKGVAYMVLERATIPPTNEQVDELFNYAVASREPERQQLLQQEPTNRLTIADFLRMFTKMQEVMKTSEAVTTTTAAT